MSPRKDPAPGPRALLMTQCLQHDFVGPIGPHDALPNLLHVGSAEARRLLGLQPEVGPVAQLMGWAAGRPPRQLRVLHIRDWHDPADPTQGDHLRRFGEHCLAGSPGARFVWQGLDAVPEPASAPWIVNATGLNDFLGTDLAARLDPLADAPLCVGLAGVWTEAKVTFLAYELRTRYPGWRLGICSALAASASRSQHFIALDQLARLLQVECFSSVGEFITFLGGEAARPPLPRATGPDRLTVRAPAGDDAPGEDPAGVLADAEDAALVRYLFRDCSEVRLRALGGGFSGNLVLLSDSTDRLGHRQVPHVVKVGDRGSIGQERAAFERVEAVLGNAAPSVTDFADLSRRGAIKYRYASMGAARGTRTFKDVYMGGLPLEELRPLLDTVFARQLGKLYAAAQLERCDLLEHYRFSPRWAASVARKERQITGLEPGTELILPGGRACRGVHHFYAEVLPGLAGGRPDYVPFAYVHGDLNGANIVVDPQQNIWLIDFFHTRRAHALMDLIKLENDLLYIFTPVDDEDDLAQALELTDHLLAVEDLAAPLPCPPAALTSPALQRAWRTVAHLRGYYPALVGTARDPLQLLVGQLRYAVHTLGFGESGPLSRRWALYAAARQAAQVERRMTARQALRVDWLQTPAVAPGAMGLTIMPGRRDFARRLDRDLQALQDAGVTHALCLATDQELARLGVPDLLARYAEAGLQARHQPIADQSVPTPQQMADLAAWTSATLDTGARLMLHCVGGLGRSGTVAACALISRGAPTEAAIAAVRRARTPRAIESARQEAFVRAWRG